MKKVLKCMGMMALVALAFTSCKKNETKSITVYANAPQFKVESVDEERLYIDNDGYGYFEQGDVCMLFNISESTPTKSHAALYGATTPGVTNVPFVNIGYGEVGEDMLDGYYAYYPGGVGHMITFLSEGENKCKFYVAPEQEYRPNLVPKDALYNASKGVNDVHLMHGDVHFEFYPICGVLALKPYEAAKRTVTKIEIVDNVFRLSGLVELIIPEVDPIEMQALFDNYDLTNPSYVAQLEAYKNKVGYNVTGEDVYNMLTGETDHYVMGKRMTLNIPGGVQLGDSKDNTPVFNIVLRPLAMSQGSHIIFTFDNGDTKDVDLSNVSRLIKPGFVLKQNLNMDNF
jgi:hypothetical protein